MALRTLATGCWGAVEGQAWQARDTPGQGPHCPMLPHRGQSGDKSVTRPARWQLLGLNLGDKVPHQKEWATRESCASEMPHMKLTLSSLQEWHSHQNPLNNWRSLRKARGEEKFILVSFRLPFCLYLKKKFNLCFSIEKVKQSVHTLG